MINVGVVGCGDVAFRTYFPSLDELEGRARVVATFDPQPDRAERAAARFPGARAYTEYELLLRHPSLDAVLNLTPAPFHRDVTTAALDAGLHVYSEKPLAATVEDAQALIEQAKRRDRVLFCAPATMATGRFRWLKQLLESGRIGDPTLAVGQMANMGPATWREYTGDPAVFYSASVGPVLDTGVYVLHGITGLLGPARSVQALGGISIPERTSAVHHMPGRKIRVESNDHMLLQLDFGNNAFAQVLSSFAVPASKMPAIELHCTGGSISVDMDVLYDANGPVDVYLFDDSELGVGGWLREVSPTPPGPSGHLIQCGPPHFIAHLEGSDAPILTAEHACHVLEIILKAEQSAREHRSLDLETTF